VSLRFSDARGKYSRVYVYIQTISESNNRDQLILFNYSLHLILCNISSQNKLDKSHLQ